MKMTNLRSLEVEKLHSDRPLKDLDSLQELLVRGVWQGADDEEIPLRWLGRELGKLISLRAVDITLHVALQMEQVLEEWLDSRDSRVQLDSFTWRFTNEFTRQQLKWIAPGVLGHDRIPHLKKLHLIIPLRAQVYMYEWEKSIRAMLCGPHRPLPVESLIVQGINPTHDTEYLSKESADALDRS